MSTTPKFYGNCSEITNVTGLKDSDMSRESTFWHWVACSLRAATVTDIQSILHTPAAITEGQMRQLFRMTFGHFARWSKNPPVDLISMPEPVAAVLPLCLCYQRHDKTLKMKMWTIIAWEIPQTRFEFLIDMFLVNLIFLREQFNCRVAVLLSLQA